MAKDDVVSKKNGDRVVKVNYSKDHPDVLAVYCSDGRFTEAVHQLMLSHEISRYDTVNLPGSAALLDSSSSTLVEVEATRKAVSFLVHGHHTREAFLIAHTACGFYNARFAGQSVETITARQLKDLQIAGIWLKKVHPSVNVHLLLADPDVKSGSVRFKHVVPGDPNKVMMIF